MQSENPVSVATPEAESHGKFFSIKWKLSIAFVLLTIGIVAIYIVIAKRTFESDKISYIFETQQRQVSQSVETIKEQVLHEVFDARSILSGYDLNTKKLAEMSQRLFAHHRSLLAIALIENDSGQVLAQVEKETGTLALLGASGTRAPASDLTFFHLKDRIFGAEIPDVASNGARIVLRVVFQLQDLFKDTFEGQDMLLAKGSEILASANSGGIDLKKLKGFLEERKTFQADLTQIKTIEGAKYLVSGASVGPSGLHVFSLISEDLALQATRTLYERSLMFLVFSFFATVVISMALSMRLTTNLFDLSRVAERFGKGDFSASPGFVSNDEIGLLARAFKKMIAEIQSLLTERVDKVRMEQELKTARTVQENLFPRESEIQIGNLKLAGLYSTTTECGGDWWYYFQRDRYLYVACADATGHGTPAALITAAIRSAFSHVELNEMSLSEIVNCCDEAVFQCSKNAIYMTAVFMRINVNTGEAAFINASHEPPMLFEYDLPSQQIGVEEIFAEPGPRLGERNKKWTEHSFRIKSGQRLFVYTDGLSSARDAQGREFDGRRQKKALLQAANETDPKKFMDRVVAAMNQYSEGRPFPDDVTFITIDHNYHVGL